MNDITILNRVATNKHSGTAKNINLGNISVLSSSVDEEPRTKLPPEENGEIEVAWEPIIIQVNNNIGLRPVATAIAGTVGNKAGVTTPSVELKKDIIPAITQRATGTTIEGILSATQLDNTSIVPASIATDISIPT